jgi:DMSO/TMAO reductase YedYZ heme-binding membrane subunit
MVKSKERLATEHLIHTFRTELFSVFFALAMRSTYSTHYIVVGFIAVIKFDPQYTYNLKIEVH